METNRATSTTSWRDGVSATHRDGMKTCTLDVYATAARAVVSYLLDLPTGDLPSDAARQENKWGLPFRMNGEPLNDPARLQLERWIIALLASAVAEARIRSDSARPTRMSRRVLTTARQAASRLVPAGPDQERLLRNLQASADQLVIDCWGTIERFAPILAERGSLTAGEVEQTIKGLFRPACTLASLCTGQVTDSPRRMPPLGQRRTVAGRFPRPD